MSGFTNAEAKATLDARFPTTGGTDYVAYSENGTSESSNLARTAVGATGWAAATTADPSVKANGTALTSAGCTVTDPATATITHYAVFTASTGGTQRTDWTAFDSSRTLGSGDTVSWAVGSLQVTLT